MYLKHDLVPKVDIMGFVKHVITENVILSIGMLSFTIPGHKIRSAIILQSDEFQ